MDDIRITDGKDNINNKVDDNNYQFSISKSLVKDGYDSIFRILSDSLPELIGGLGGAKIGVAVVKGTAKLPPMQRVMLGVVSTGMSALCIGLAGTVVRNVRKNSEHGSEDSIIVQIPKKVFEEMVNGEGDSGKKEFVTKTAKKLVEFNNSNSTSNGGLSTDGGSSWGTGSGTVSEASTSTVGKTTEYLNNMKDKVD